MKAQIAYLKYKLDSSFWFVPGLMIICAIALSFAMVALDRALQDASVDVSDWLYSATPDGARQLLTTIASSVITVTSLVFSMTLVALTLASQQLGPRLLENFMRNKANQLVLGFFVATFVYSLLVLRTISNMDDAHFVPSIATAAAIIMSIGSFGILIFFIHHVAESIQADAIIANVSDNLTKLIEKNFGEGAKGSESGVPADSRGWPENFDQKAVPVIARKSGYIQTLDLKRLKTLAAEYHVRIRLECRPGHFVVEGCPVANVSPGDDCSGDLRKDILATFVFGPKRTPAQDIEYEIRVIAEIAVRALSPGINDHYTAVTCVDRLAASLVPVLRSAPPSADIKDSEGNVVLRTIPSDFEGMLDAAFNDIRQSAAGNTAVIIRLLEALALMARQCCRNQHRSAIAKHVEMVARAAEKFLSEPNDRLDVDERLDAARKSLKHKA